MVRISRQDNPFYGLGGKGRPNQKRLKKFKLDQKAHQEVFCKYCKKKGLPRIDDFRRTSDFKSRYYSCEHCKRILNHEFLPYRVRVFDPEKNDYYFVEI